MINLDDYNRLFDKTPSILLEAFKTTAIDIINADIEGYKKLKQLVQDLIGDLGDYEILAYTTGTEAVDKALLWSMKLNGYSKVVKFKEVYHGNSLLLHEKKLHSLPYQLYNIPFQKESEQVLLEHLGTVENSIVLVEPHFGDYGHRFNDGFYQTLEKICQENKNILFVDEIRSGMFHTGEFLFSQGVNIAPDIICLSKGLALGIPLALACFKKTSFPKIDTKEMEIYRTSQSLNSCSIQRAISLLIYFAKPEIKQQMQNIQGMLKRAFDLLKNHPFLTSVEVSGFLVHLCIKTENTNFTRLLLLFKYLLSSEIKCRFPEKGTLILVFPIDVSESAIYYTITKLKEALDRFNPSKTALNFINI